MDDTQLLRYSRHILLPEIGIEGQEILLASHALIIGAGGLGSPAAMFLAASGVGTITLCDDDDVDLTNLQRQLMHRTSSVGLPKTTSALQTLHEINPGITVTAVTERAGPAQLDTLVRAADVVLDCSDNFATRYALNRACLSHRKPLVSGAAIRFEGQVAVFDFRERNGPCYNCLFPEQQDAEETRCATMGVFAPAVGVVGSLQAAEALKLLIGTGQSLHGRLLVTDFLYAGFRTVSLSRDPSCQACGNL